MPVQSCPQILLLNHPLTLSLLHQSFCSENCFPMNLVNQGVLFHRLWNRLQTGLIFFLPMFLSFFLSFFTPLLIFGHILEQHVLDLDYFEMMIWVNEEGIVKKIFRENVPSITSIQTSANRGPDLRFVHKENHKPV